MESAGISVSAGEVGDLFRLKRRKIKVAGAPKMPLNGYVRYMNDRRDNLRKECPDKTAIEHTRMIGEEWHQLPIAYKSPYLEAAEKDRQRYNAELHEFLINHPEILETELAKSKVHKNSNVEEMAETSAQKEKIASSKEKKITTKENQNHSKDEDNETRESVQGSEKKYRIPVSQSNALNIRNPDCDNNLNSTCAAASLMPGEIPIFTNEFLEHNKVFDMELRTLRKTKTDLDQQNAVLEKHVDNMKCGVKKLSTENTALEETNSLLQTYLYNLKYNLAAGLSGLGIPTEPNGATFQNIDKYVSDLIAMVSSNSHEQANVNTAKDIIRKLDLHKYN